MRIAAAGVECGAAEEPLFVFRFPRYAVFLLQHRFIENEAGMQKIETYKNCVLDTRAHARGDGQGWIAEISIVRRTSLGMVDKQFMLPETFPNAAAAMEAALEAGRRRVDAEIEPNDAVEQPSAQ
jgi:hypothetical protein